MLTDRRTPTPQPYLNNDLVSEVTGFQKMRDSREVEESQCDCPKPGQTCPFRFQISYLPNQTATLAITKATVK
jgi:hypothetical protein